MPTIPECKTILFNLGIRFGISPVLISSLLLNDLDKSDIVSGSIGIVELEAAIEVWKGNGFPDYVGNKKETLNPKNPGFSGVEFRLPFTPWSAEIKEQVNGKQNGIPRMARGRKMVAAAKDDST